MNWNVNENETKEKLMEFSHSFVFQVWRKKNETLLFHSFYARKSVFFDAGNLFYFFLYSLFLFSFSLIFHFCFFKIHQSFVNVLFCFVILQLNFKVPFERAEKIRLKTFFKVGKEQIWKVSKNWRKLRAEKLQRFPVSFLAKRF